MSLTALAEQISYSKSHLSKVETGAKRPVRDLAVRCDSALGAEGELARLAIAPSGPDEEGPSPRTAWLDLSASGPLPRWTGGDAFEAAAEMFRTARMLGRGHSPTVVLQLAPAVVRTMTGLAQTTSGPAKDELLVLAAHAAEFTGWMMQEAGDDRACESWTQLAVELGRTARAHHFGDYALVRLSLMRLYQGDARRTVDLAAQVREQKNAYQPIRMLAAYREAQGHALAGNLARCQEALDLARQLQATGPVAAVEEAAASGRRGYDPMRFGSSTRSTFSDLVTGWCLYDLGHLEESAACLERGRAGISPDSYRARARFGVRLALAYAAAKKLIDAHRVLGDSQSAVERVDSATIRHDLRALSRTIGRWRDDPYVRDLQPRIAGLMTATLAT